MFIEIHTNGRLRKRIKVPDDLPEIEFLTWETNALIREQFINELLHLVVQNIAPIFHHEITVEYYIVFESK